ncbi:hypothetical protein HGRIS_014347 [Hohenbuehelia grisea]|uniref:GPI anchored protein n=1 Tax=Hohenbuehelia grisea TaxID=104357 RepID=A0ABR3JT33_9AGAR
MLLLLSLLCLSLVHAQTTVTLYRVQESDAPSLGIESLSVSVGGVGPDGATTYVYSELVTEIVQSQQHTTQTQTFPTNSPQVDILTIAEAESVYRLSAQAAAGSNLPNISVDVSCSFGASSAGICQEMAWGLGGSITETLTTSFTGHVVPFATLTVSTPLPTSSSLQPASSSSSNSALQTEGLGAFALVWVVFVASLVV